MLYDYIHISILDAPHNNITRDIAFYHQDFPLQKFNTRR